MLLTVIACVIQKIFCNCCCVDVRICCNLWDCNVYWTRELRNIAFFNALKGCHQTSTVLLQIEERALPGVPGLCAGKPLMYFGAGAKKWAEIDVSAAITIIKRFAVLISGHTIISHDVISATKFQFTFQNCGSTGKCPSFSCVISAYQKECLPRWNALNLVICCLNWD